MLQLLESATNFAYAHYPTSQRVYDDIPFAGLRLKKTSTGGLVPANFVQLTKMMAYKRVDCSWWKFSGPFALSLEEQEDKHWRWVSFIRRLRKQDEWLRCVAIRTEDGEVQGAAIYTRRGQSLLESDKGAVYIHYLATAPRNRKKYAKRPEYTGIGTALVTLVAAHSYQWGLEGRVGAHSLPRARKFYADRDFVKTGDEVDRMIHFELPPSAAQRLLDDARVF